MFTACGGNQEEMDKDVEEFLKQERRKQTDELIESIEEEEEELVEEGSLGL